MAAACLAVSVCSAATAQDNPYKISDLLYREFTEAFNYRTSQEGVARARAMYRHADQIGDRKAQCIALTIPVIYYTMHTDDAAFERAVWELQDAATKYGYEQYYYYGVTNRVQYLINRNRTSDAFVYVSDVEREARRRKSAYGSFTALNALGQLHASSSVYGRPSTATRRLSTTDSATCATKTWLRSTARLPSATKFLPTTARCCAMPRRATP